MPDLIFKKNTANAQDILEHFKSCGEFYNDLSKRTDVQAYIEKLIDKAFRYETWCGEKLIGFLAFYHNSNGMDFISNLSISEDWQKQRLAASLLSKGMDFSKANGQNEICLEVAKNNVNAQKFYEKAGFSQYDENGTSYFLSLKLGI